MSVARFRVSGRLDMASRPSVGTVTIDRGAGLFSVRPLRSHKVYTLPLFVVARMVIRSIVVTEVSQARAEKRARKARR